MQGKSKINIHHECIATYSIQNAKLFKKRRRCDDSVVILGMHLEILCKCLTCITAQDPRTEKQDPSKT